MNQRILFPPPIPAYQAARHPPLPVRVQVKDRQDRGDSMPQQETHPGFRVAELETLPGVYFPPGKGRKS